ncbi:Leucine-rich_repeat domain superfamily [Hexamita inflata]|uniref:Leucine-rich repeat domain superfamily n=1 Tax=Hexamita inflata TaxID=28002 RepID=A0AA86UK42_9EUKA|nr:Leucine-rich repeat domain superfamily [Hexamita inflata]
MRKKCFTNCCKKQIAEVERKAPESNIQPEKIDAITQTVQEQPIQEKKIERIIEFRTVASIAEYMKRDELFAQEDIKQFDATPINKSSQLKLNKNKIINIQLIQIITQLTTLDLSENLIKDIQPISKLISCYD